MTDDKKELPTAVGPDLAPTLSQVRAFGVGDRVAVLSPESRAGTAGAANVVLTPEQMGLLAHIERYAPTRELGRGGMGKVDVVFDRALGRTVARKTVLDERHRALLVTEAQICAQLEHPSIVPVYDLRTDADGSPECTMRLVRGRTLRDVLDDSSETTKLTLAGKLGILKQICLAADYAHSRGVVHRDLKPENVIVGEFGEVYVLDWGVAYIQETSDIHRASSGTELSVAGSPGYMAPEQALGERIDARTDVFALGVMLYEVLTGHRPFDDRDLPSILKRVTQATFPPPSKVEPAVPAAFDGLVRACLRKNPDERPSSARFIADAIDHFLDEERQRAEREREAQMLTKEGEHALKTAESLDSEARRLRSTAEAMLAALLPSDTAERKKPAWDLEQQGKQLAAEAARSLARAEAAFTRALGRVPNHAGARAGLAALHYRQFLLAEAAGDHETMAQQLDLARAYDDGPLALELADQGELVVESEPERIPFVVARYEEDGHLLRALERFRGVTPAGPISLPSGSYLVTFTTREGEVRHPIRIERAKRHRLRFRPPIEPLSADMVLVPGGPARVLLPRATTLSAVCVDDFAIGRFPVTLAEYVEFLDDICDAPSFRRRIPGHGFQGEIVRSDGPGSWYLAPDAIEGEGADRVRGREMELPVFGVCWYDALAFAEWRSKRSGRRYRLPTDLEWEKAMRGADGRAFPMGHYLDPCFAKLRESRPEASQPEPVGAFPLDESPYGVRDLAGGVGDWTSTMVDGAPPPALDDEGRKEADERQAYWRGGNWGSAATARGMRYPMKLTQRTHGVGFRLAMDVSGPGSEVVVEPMKP